MTPFNLKEEMEEGILRPIGALYCDEGFKSGRR